MGEFYTNWKRKFSKIFILFMYIPCIIRHFAYIPLLWLLAACSVPSSSQKEENYKQVRYYMRYVEESRELQAELRILGDSSTRALESKPLLNKETPLSYKKLPKLGHQYKLTMELAAPDSLYFMSFESPNGKSYEQTLPFRRSFRFRIASDGGLSKKYGGVLIWEGAPLQSEDGLVLNIFDENGKSISINYGGKTPEPNTLVLAPSQLASLAEGKLRIGLTKKTNAYRDEGQTRIIWSVEQYYKPIYSQLQSADSD